LLHDEEAAMGSEVSITSCTASYSGEDGQDGDKICDGNTGSRWSAGCSGPECSVEPFNIGASIVLNVGSTAKEINGIGIFVNDANYLSTVRDVEIFDDARAEGQQALGRFELERNQGWTYFGGFSTTAKSLRLEIKTNHGWPRTAVIYEMKLLSGVVMTFARWINVINGSWIRGNMEQGDKFEELAATCKGDAADHVSGKIDVTSAGDCEQRCLSQDNCFAYVTGAAKCYLKGRCEGPVGKCAGTMCAYRLTGLKGSTFQALATKCPQGNALGGKQVLNSVAECESLCMADSRCNGFNFNSNLKQCYLKKVCDGVVGHCTAARCGYGRI
jgi:hypothetical protein